LVHELTHLVVHQATFSPYGQLPLWLDEGLAMYSEGELDSDFRSCLEGAILEDELISVRSLCSPFSAYSEKACLSYAQSYSLVEYLLDNYGQDKMLDLLALLKQGSTYDEALTEVYGFDIDGLDARWRATLASHTVIASKARQSHPALIAVLAALATVLILWGALALEKRIWRRSSGKSTM
jgi:acyl-CoA-binding protein